MIFPPRFLEVLWRFDSFLLPVPHNEYMLLLMVSKGDMPPAQFALWIVMLTCASTAVGHSYPAPPLFISILLRFGAVSVCCCWLHVSTLKCRYQANWYRSRALRHIRCRPQRMVYNWRDKRVHFNAKRSRPSKVNCFNSFDHFSDRF
jgi:hypothetical protein